MKSKPESERHDQQDWAIVVIILLIGFLCVALAGQWALRLSPSWKVNTDMESNLDPNADFGTNQPAGFIEPLDPNILTRPAWENVFLTPGAHFVTKTPLSQAQLPAGTQAAGSTAASLVPTAAGTTVVPTNTVFVTNTVVPTNTFVWLPLPPATATKKKPPPPPADTPTNTPIPVIDLEISMTDSGSYSAGAPHDYTVTVFNNSTSAVTGAVVNDPFGAQVTGVSWTCTPGPGASCNPGSGNPFTDTINIPAGGSVSYTVTANVSLYSAGPLPNTVAVTAAYETDPGDNTAMLTTAGPGAGGGLINIGPGDGNPDYLTQGTSIIMVISPAIVADGTGNYDFVYYERIAPAPAPPGITDPRVDMDAVQILISSDGATWHPVFYWGDGASDTNTNLALPAGPWCAAEVDNCSIPDTTFYNSTGIAIDIDNLSLSGSYPWVQIVSPATAPAGPDLDGASDIDAIQPYYP